MTLAISNSTQSISSSVRVPLSLQSFDAMYSPKIVKLSLDVHFSLTSWLRVPKISSFSSSIFSWYVFPPLTLLFYLCSAFASFEVLTIFVDVTDIHWGERSLSDSPSDWVKFKLFSTPVIFLHCLHQIYLQHLTIVRRKKTMIDLADLDMTMMWPSWFWFGVVVESCQNFKLPSLSFNLSADPDERPDLDFFLSSLLALTYRSRNFTNAFSASSAKI